MENFEYRAGTKVLFGKGQIENLPTEVKQYGSKVLLCYGGGSIKKIGIYDEIHKLLSDCEIYELAGIAPNPKIESVREGVRICREHGVDVILAVGGGSVIDCAKVVSVAVYYEGEPWDMVKNAVQAEKTLPLITILTVAATGSEYDAGAVISNTTTNEKLGYDSELVRPKASILDPTYTFSVSAKQTAAGAIDIMSHLMEQYFTAQSTFLADQMLTGAMKTVIRYAPIAVRDPDNYEARSELMWLSSLACNGILSTGCQYSGWSCHGIEHELSAFYDVTHGVGLAIVTPRWMRHILNEQTVSRFAKFGIDVWGLNASQDERSIAEQAIAKTAAFFASLGVPMTLTELGIGTEHFEEMAEHAVEANWLSYAYVPLTKEDVSEILIHCLYPELADHDADVAGHSTFFLGFPIWWYTAPTIINRFLESYDFTGKRIVLFATSGGSGFGKTVQKLHEGMIGDVELEEGRLLNGSISTAELSKWAAQLLKQ